MLPHQFPFRFVDEVTTYIKMKKMNGHFDPSSMYPYLGKQPDVPSTIMIEGLAQLSVLFAQMETKPLEDNEFPLLGKIDTNIISTLRWDQTVNYALTPIRILSKQAVFSGLVTDSDGQRIITATLGVAIGKKGVELS